MTHVMSGLLVVGLVLTGASAARAQTPPPTADTGAYVSVAVGGQPLTRSFASSGTFSSFNETGRYEVNQNIGAANMFDIGGGYRFMKHIAVGASVWSARSKSAVAAAASIPDPVFFGRFTTVPAGDNGLKQSTLGVNIFVTYTRPVADRFDVAVSLGPTIVKTTLDAGSVAVTPNTQQVRLSSDRQSKTSAKAGNVGVDFTYRLNAIYNVGFFARYAGGELDLPVVKKLKVGSLQTGGLFRYRF